MATLALAAAGSALGGAILPGGISLLGASLSGAAIGQAVGAMAGRYVDQALFGSSGQSQQVEGARLSDLQVVSSTEGAVIPRLYGRARMAGQVIWATQLDEEIITTTESAGGGKGSGPSVSTTQYNYYANFAIGLCEGEISRIGTVWADGKPISLKDVTYRIYQGSETQQPDSLIVSKEGEGNAPAYRGLAYIVFEHMALAQFGNRIPQLNFEVFRPVDDFEQTIKAVTMLPGSGEFVYNKTQVFQDNGGETVPENVHTAQGVSDWTASLDDMETSLPQVKAVSLVVSWFGNDLRAGQCTLRPMVDNSIKITTPLGWSVAGLSRQSASVVSDYQGGASYGGTPSDTGVIDAIQDLRSRNIRAVFNPFILMDIPTDNILSDPYGGLSQGAYPWRGLMTSDPAPYQAGTVDKTPFSRIQIEHFIGTASPSDFTVSGQSVLYHGAQEWSYRRMILHYAFLCKAAGGVDAFLLGSELRGLTRLRDENNAFPFVEALISLAADVRSILGDQTVITYGADWSEYFGYHPQDGSGDVWFHLDPLWSSPDIDVIGMDCYWPLSDWRDGDTHLDRQNGVSSLYDLDYLRGNIGGGEGYDWYYASSEDRDNQVRTSITDGLGKPWLFRYKDIKNWWQNLHYNRIGGVEQSTPTGWVPESKPFWFTEVGCGAVDKGANQPNIFSDPKSVQSGLPFYSNGNRDDFMQRQYLQAFHSYFDRFAEHYQAGSNPVSVLTGQAMVDSTHIFDYSWDARPYPAFPLDNESWGDGSNWRTGHWLNGRLGDAPLDAAVHAICRDYGVETVQTRQLAGLMSGVIVTGLQSLRSVLQPLELAFFFDSFESGRDIVFQARSGGKLIEIDKSQLVETKPTAGLYMIHRAQETDLPSVARLSFIENGFEYGQGTVESRRLVGGSNHVAPANLPIVLEPNQALSIARSWLHESWANRERISFTLPPSLLFLEPTDHLRLSLSDEKRDMRVTELTNINGLEVVGQSYEETVFKSVVDTDRSESWVPPIIYGTPKSYLMDLPLLEDKDDPLAGYSAAYLSPWPGKVAFYRSPELSGYHIDSVVSAPATLGKTITDLAVGFPHRRNFAATLEVSLSYGVLASLSDLSLFAGGNLAALQHDNSEWEVFAFQQAELIGQGHYRLSVLLRGLRGTEHLSQQPVLKDAAFVLLNSAIGQTALSLDQRGLPLQWLIGPATENLSSPSFSALLHSHNTYGLRPYAPVHPKLKLQADGYQISWIRRSRIGADSWEGSDIALGEEREAYELDVMQGENVLRNFSVSAAEVFYPQTDFINDFAVLPALLTVRIYQVSVVYGRGLPLETSFAL